MENRYVRHVRWPGWVWVGMGLVFFALLMVSALRTSKLATARFAAEQIKAAPLVRDPPHRRWDPADGSLDSRRQLEAVRGWRHWMDSLHKTPGGIAIYDSITRAHPGLMDSAKEVEDYYSNQLK